MTTPTHAAEYSPDSESTARATPCIAYQLATTHEHNSSEQDQPPLFTRQRQRDLSRSNSHLRPGCLYDTALPPPMPHINLSISLTMRYARLTTGYVLRYDAQQAEYTGCIYLNPSVTSLTPAHPTSNQQYQTAASSLITALLRSVALV